MKERVLINTHFSSLEWKSRRLTLVSPTYAGIIVSPPLKSQGPTLPSVFDNQFKLAFSHPPAGRALCIEVGHRVVGLRNKYSGDGTNKTVTAKIWPLSGEIPSNILSCSLFARQRTEESGVGAGRHSWWGSTTSTRATSARSSRACPGTPCPRVPRDPVALPPPSVAHPPRGPPAS